MRVRISPRIHKGPRKLAEYSLIGFMPKLVFTAKEGVVTVQNMESGEETTTEAPDPLVVLRELLGRRIRHERFRFVGGVVGYISYDAVRYWEELPDMAVNDLEFPEMLPRATITPKMSLHLLRLSDPNRSMPNLVSSLFSPFGTFLYLQQRLRTLSNRNGINVNISVGPLLR